MKLIPLPAFSDNYIWMLHDGRTALVVDPGDAQPVLEVLHRESLALQAILVTHHHADHTGGVETLHIATGARVYAPASEPLAEHAKGLKGGDTVSTLGLEFSTIDVPGHTAGHIALFCADAPGGPVLFCGDTLFSAGCGRLFEGTPQQMQDSLDRLAALPDNTRVCCAHEYTLSNLKFAMHVEPGNTQLATYQAQCQQLRGSNMPTLPSTIAQERAINPFLRCSEPAVIASVRTHDATATDRRGIFATLREWKNIYR
jgi:hydroxyacylglutathione hydrolase